MAEQPMGSAEQLTEKMHQLLGDVDKVSLLITTIQHEMAHLQPNGPRAPRMALLKRQLGEVHMRLEGLHDFISACELQAHTKPEEEEIDLWM
jgi:hypothetical protein